MYHAPVPLDVDEQEFESSELAPEPVGAETGSDRLREAHLLHGQVEARALFAPYFAIVGVGAALLTGWAMFGAVRLELIVGWVAIVSFLNWAVCRRALEAAAWGGKNQRPHRTWVSVAEALGLACVWASLPTYAFATQAPDVQIVIGGAMAAMVTAAVALSAVPAASFTWISTLTAAFCLTYFFGSRSLDPKLGLTFLGVAAVGIFGIARLTRWTFEQLQTIARTRTQAESIRLLLKEYEHRGVGWLWQDDAENRVVYISSRMTALLGRTSAANFSIPACARPRSSANGNRAACSRPSARSTSVSVGSVASARP